jgi:decaprenylphospho-beta-D-erythro-pentofuranosid-2-ulose 2-reductase
MEENVLILGAASDMAVAIARKFAAEGYSVTLAARNVEKLEALASDLKIRHDANVFPVQFDALDFEAHESFYRTLPERPDVVICVFGLLGDQTIAQKNFKAAQQIINTNYVGAVSILNVVANDFEHRKKGTIVGISSVAGERGRQSNYLYGSAKAGFTAFLSGLRNRLYHYGAHVLTVKPGFVKTQMIENMKTPASITAIPRQVADHIFKAVRKKKDSIYVLPIWAMIMMVIKTIPEGVFKRLRL